MTEMEIGHFGDGQVAASAKLHLQGESVRQREFQSYVDIARRFAPSGRWLDIGCGTGTLILCARRFDIVTDGIELTADRRQLARQVTGATIHDLPLELLNLASESFAAVTLINVFSHLTRPTETLSHIRRVLSPGGIVLLRTGEIGSNVRRHHVFSWDLGDHLYFLGESTIDSYAKKLDFRLVYRDKTWLPAAVYTRDRLKMKGRSRRRNAIKGAIIHFPGAFPLLRWYMLHRRQAGNPVYTSNLVLRKE